METRHVLYFIAALVMTLVITVIILKRLIPKLRSMKMGQKILDIGPRWHKSKEGTPTMGGLSFIIAMTVTFATVGIYALVNSNRLWAIQFLITYLMALLYAAIGIWDDSLKLRKRENEGFKAWQKFVLQVAIAAAYLAAMTRFCGLTTELHIPFANVYVDLGWGYYVVAGLIIVGIVNSVNLTDGIDGLASSVTTVVGAFFAVAAFVIGADNALIASLPAAIISAMMMGGCLGFLVYNFYPARIFMGDTGSLFLGGLVAGLAFLIGSPLLVLLVGIVYVCEAASDIIQVFFFKLTHKRVFKMAPIHHHFEQCGWSEIKICAVFSIVTLLAAVGAFFGLPR